MIRLPITALLLIVTISIQAEQKNIRLKTVPDFLHNEWKIVLGQNNKGAIEPAKGSLITEPYMVLFIKKESNYSGYYTQIGSISGPSRTSPINQLICSFVIFNGCKPTTKGRCNVSMWCRVIQPDGKVYPETPAMEVWQNKSASRARALELSIQYLRIVVEPHELRGRHTIQAQVRDDNTGVVLSLQKTFSATDAEFSERHNPAVQWALRDKPHRVHVPH